MALAVPPGGSSPPAPEPRAAPRPYTPAGLPHVSYPHVTVVVVNYCQWKNTARLVRQLRRSHAIRDGLADIVVVDNASPPHRLAKRAGRMIGVSVTRPDHNTGFAKAVNRGAKQTRGQWVLLINPDVTVPDGFLDDVLAAADLAVAFDPACGVVGFQLRNRDGSPQASAGPFPTLSNTLAGLVLPRARRKCRHQSLAGRHPVPWVTGGCALVRRDCFDRLGGLDETFFLYYEDVDFCHRARAAGWTVWYEPTVVVTHHWPLHDRKVPAPLRLMTRHALVTYARKHWSVWQAAVLRGVVRVEAVVRQFGAWLRGEPDAAECYRDLQRVVGLVARGNLAAATTRIKAAAVRLAPVAAAQDGKTV
ncbi:MAG TPA: glycosyltransferase family 2 protein [Fimbriiglobus sp.]|jgi:GT2 family glycosyltransferase